MTRLSHQEHTRWVTALRDLAGFREPPVLSDLTLFTTSGPLNGTKGAKIERMVAELGTYVVHLAFERDCIVPSVNLYMQKPNGSRVVSDASLHATDDAAHIAFLTKRNGWVIDAHGRPATFKLPPVA